MTDVARIFAPLLVWLALFSGVYGLHGIGCGLGWPDASVGPWPLHRAALVAAWIGAVILQSLLLLALARPLRSTRPFVQGVSLTLAVSGVVAVGWTLFPVLFVSSCP
jgi:hypothetical protein